jgi:hypothetical protein
VRVIGTYENTAVSAELLKADPDIGLDVLNQMTNVDGAVSVWQSCGYENLAVRHGLIVWGWGS